MKKMIYPAFIATIFALSAFSYVQNNPWKLKDDQYTVKFIGKKGKEVEGIFKGLKSEIIFDENNLKESVIKASIDANTVNTGNGMRNKHARQGLDAEHFPIISFQSTSIIKTINGFEATGKLTLRDVTKEVKLPFTFSRNADGGVFNGILSVIPEEYHVKKSGTPELIDIELTVAVIR